MNKVFKASYWSILTEVIAKVISPLSFLVLTRILSPEDFGVVAVATTFISFINIVTDLGVSKVLIQDPNNDPNYRMRLNNTSFWFNTSMGGALFVFSVFFSNKIASVFGSASSADVIKVMSLQILFFSLSAVQNANLKKDLNFRFLFFTRIITLTMPILVAIPIALKGGGYWSIVIANVAGSFFNTIVLWMYSSWKPLFIFDFSILGDIIGKSIWNTFDEIIVWIPIGLDSYLISKYMNMHSLGLYTTSRTLFAAAISISLGAILPVLYSHLSQIQNNASEFKKTVMFSQKIIYIIAGTMGLLVFIFSDTIEGILFTGKWDGIAKILGMVFLIMSNGYFYSVLQEALRAKGYFKELFLVKFISMFIIVPLLVLVSFKADIYIYTIARSFSLYIWIFGVFYFSRRILSIYFLDFVKNSMSFLCILISSLILNLLIDKFAPSYELNVLLLKIVLSLSAISLLIYFEKENVMRVKKLILKK